MLYYILRLLYHFVDLYVYRYYAATFDGDIGFMIPAKFVSVRAIFAGMYLNNQYGVTDASNVAFLASSGVSSGQGIDKTGFRLRGGVSEYEFLIGSNHYPADGRVQNDLYGSENFLHNLKTLQRSADKSHQVRFDLDDLRCIHPTSRDKEKGYVLGNSAAAVATVNESLKWLYSVDLTKEGELSGVSTRALDIQAFFSRTYTSSYSGIPATPAANFQCASDGASGGLWVQCTLMIDKIMKLSAADGGPRMFS